MRTSLLVPCVAALITLFLAPVEASTQEAREPVGHGHVISGNPLILVAGWFNAEYERKISEAATVGFSGGWLDVKDADYTSLNAFFRYYPQVAAFTGFYVGGRAGIHNVEEDGDDDPFTTFGLGVDIGYAWLLGPGRSFYVGIGIGATRLLGGDLDDVSATIPSVRLVNIGIAF